MTLKIGIPAYSMNDSLGVHKDYIIFAMNYGIPIILSPYERPRTDLDLLILPGGADMNPSLYNEAPHPYTQNTDVFKHYFYTHHLDTYINQRTPIFGICLGFQMLCAKFGAKIIQHKALRCSKPYDPFSPLNRDWKEFFVDTIIYKTKDFTKPVPNYSNTLSYVAADNQSHNIAKIDVNSYHHQCVLSLDNTPLIAVAKECHEDIIEAMVHTTLPIAGVQFHPERACNIDLVKNLIHFITNRK